MKLLVISDIHGSLYYAKKILEIVEKEKPDQIAFRRLILSRTKKQFNR